VLRALLGGFHTAPPARVLQPTARPIRRRETVKPRPIALQGDVTDEE